jgi:3-hydroxyisobutyrate dehydrogenase-like beta-hydroxyacid dehydrogenase
MTGTSATLGFIGLGVMGSGMCANLVRKAGRPVHVFDMVADAVAAQVANGAVAAASVADVARAARVIFLSLPGGHQVAQVCAQIAEVAEPGTLVVDLSTTSVAEARAVAADLEASGLRFADAPVARTRQAAIDGTLSIMVGASEATFAEVLPLLSHMGSDVTHCGAVGCGQVVKLVNNCLLFQHVASIAEMMVVAERAGVTGEKLIEAVGLGSGNSFALQNHAKKAMAPRDFPLKAFSSAYTLKDLAYAVELAEQMGVEPKMAQLAEGYYRQAVDAGIGEEYFPAIIKLVEGA